MIVITWSELFPFGPPEPERSQRPGWAVRQVTSAFWTGGRQTGSNGAIESPGILSLRFECKHCAGASLVSSNRELDQREERGELNDYPEGMGKDQWIQTANQR